MTEAADRYERIPVEMKALTQWVIWGVKEEKPKIPYTPLPPYTVEAKANDSSTWAGFDAAVSAAARLGRGGIGFEFGVEPCGIAGLDLDHVINDAGELEEWAADVVRAMDSYTEYSPSGRGLHILFKMTEPLSSFCVGHKKVIASGQVLEVYDAGRYFTMTGRVYGDVKPLNERTAALKKICARYFGKPSETKTAASAEPSIGAASSSSNAELLERMLDSELGALIYPLYHGITNGYNSQSEADLALCNYLAIFTNCDARLMDAIFRTSELMRPKWDERHGAQTYGDMTIEKAIAGTRERSGKAEGKASTEGEKGRADNNSQEQADDVRLKTAAECLDNFIQECLKSREGKAISTGFSELDKLLDGGLYPGLYFIGAISALGKTTLALQIADNIAKNERAVMIFSLEMSRNELMAKTLSRESLVRSLKQTRTTTNALTTRGILRASFTNDAQERLVHEAIEAYATWGENIAIAESIGNIGVEKIKANVKGFMSVNDVAPVVVIDYLQILAPYSERYTDKQNVDKNVLELKRLSRDYQIPIIGISSFNRENYKEAVSMASFKESGAIEYSSDVLIGMQVEGIDREEDEKDTVYKARIQRILASVDERKQRGDPVPVELKILKHRNGIPGRVPLEFYSRFNYFQERGSAIV